MKIEDFLPKWIGVSMENMTSFFSFLIDEECRELSHEEFAEWAQRIGYITPERDKTYRLESVYPMCKSIYEDGFNYRNIPNINDGDRLINGRHRVCVMNALGVTETPVLHTPDLANHLATDLGLQDFFNSEEGTRFRSSESFRLLSVRN
jgi:hypothetical protein